MSKKKKAIKRHFPWLFLALILVFSIWMTYLYGVFYVPSLPHAEIPPYLSSDPLQDLPAVSEAHRDEAPLQDGTQQDTEPPAKASSSSTSDENRLTSRRTGVYNILCVGRDDAAFNTDALLLVSFDTQNHTANVVQIPRDTYCDGGKINALWAKYRTRAKKNGIVDADSSAMDTLCKTIEQTLCIKIDHWVLCGLTAVREVVDALGGVTVNVPYDMDYDDPIQNLSIHLTAGKQTLDGAQAEGLIRFRAGYIRGDLGRIDMQKLFLSALLEKARQVSLLTLPSIVTTAAKHITSDLSFSDLIFFAKSAQKLNTAHVSFLTLPGTDCRAFGDNGAWYYVLSSRGTLDAVNRYLNVYAVEVEASQFDRDHRLTDETSETIQAYYQADLSAHVSTADSLDQNGIDIAVIPD